MRGWLVLVLSTMGVLVLLGALVGGSVAGSHRRGVAVASRDIQPARVSAAQLQSALRDQETGLRGYLISADRQFLSRITTGMRAEQAAAQDIRQRLGGRAELIADLDAIETAAADWRTNYAEPLIASVTPNTPDGRAQCHGRTRQSRIRPSACSFSIRRTRT